MARGLNEVNIIGRIQPNDPELRYTQSGQAVCNFKVVTDESYKDREGNMVERSEWHNIVFWGKAGEIINQYMKKGRQIYLKGRIQTRKYEDREGQTKYITEIHGTDFVFLDGGPGGGDSNGGGEYSQVPQSAPKQNSGSSPTASPVEEDDLPF
jgi:single-strand DNA-binding protein